MAQPAGDVWVRPLSMSMGGVVMSVFKSLRGVGAAACVAISLLLLMASGASATSSVYICVGEEAGSTVRSGGTTGSCKTKETSVALPSEAAEQEKLLSILPYLKYVASGVGGKPTIQVSGANLQILSGSGSTKGTVNGAGNLVIGYDENKEGKHAQTGSHNLILGEQQTFTSYGGLDAGLEDTISGPFATVTGGEKKNPRGRAAKCGASLSGGKFNTASGEWSWIGGGAANNATGGYDSVSGGYGNTAESHYGLASILGGYLNTASGSEAVVDGGAFNKATSGHSWIGGGEENSSSGQGASVSGGQQNTASGAWASVGGGQENTASGPRASVSGGERNRATSSWSWVGGGRANAAESFWSSVYGGKEVKCSFEYCHLP
jgi:hypothetical protein